MMEGSSPSFPLSSMDREEHVIVLDRVSGLARLDRCHRRYVVFLDRFLASHCDQFWIQLCYFVSLSLWGSLALMLLEPSNTGFSPRYVDMLFMSTSALTNTGLVTFDVEDLSSSQVAVLTLLMLFGGDIFVSLLGLVLRRDSGGDDKQGATDNWVDPEGLELGETDTDHRSAVDRSDIVADGRRLKYNSMRYLGYVILGYIVLIHVGGALIILRYVTVVSSARDVLKGKGIDGLLFAISVTVTSFSNGGLIPTNESMVLFRENSGLLLIIILQILAGSAMFPLFLKLVIGGLRKVTKMPEFELMVTKPGEVRFSRLLPNLQAAMLSLTVVAFIGIQVSLLCAMDWNSAVFDGLNSYQKFVNALFMAVNTRHAGEGTLDLSIVSPAVLVLFIAMMYLPSSTSFTPFEEEDNTSARNEKDKAKIGLIVQKLIFSPLSCVVIFIIAICIAERRKISKDPMNFSIFKIIFEVTSAYGNAGLSMGYSCARQLHLISSCEDKSYGFSGWWSDEGKLILALVMLYGRLKKFTVRNGKAWKL